MKHAPSIVPATPVRILKITSCPSCSGKSKLTYHVGCTTNSDIHFRIHANSRAGYFSNDWVKLSALHQALVKKGDDKPFTSFALHRLFEGKSINTPAFLLAALIGEGLVLPSKTHKRCYECTDGAAFMAATKALIKSAVDLKVKTAAEKATVKSTPAPPAKKTPYKSTKKA